MVYSDEDVEYYVTRFALPDDCQLVILIYGEKPIEDIIRRSDTIALIESFRKERKYKDI